MELLFKGVVHPWLCDSMGHLTTRCYMGMFDDATYHMLFHVFGYEPANEKWQGRGWADVRHTLEYVAEVRAGELVHIEGEITKLGSKSVTTSYVMKKTGVEEVAARMEAVTVLFDLVERKAITLPDDLRFKAEKLMNSGVS